MKKEQTTYFTLDNGLRLVHIHRPGATTGIAGIAVNAGSRDELPQFYGIAHFVEHTIFKGTGRRRSHHIINRMESVGGELNAYTTKEETFVYSIYPRGNSARAFDLIADLISNSKFPETELKREKQVVADEIESYLDTPSDAIFDDFDDLIFSGSGLGHNILGNKDSLERLSSTDCLRWLTGHFVSRRMVLFYSGSDNADLFVRLANKYFSDIHIGDGTELKRNEISFSAPRFDIRRDINSHQSHTVIGARVGGMYSHDRYALSLMNNILGGPGMNSLLNVALRERRGLVYSVESSLVLYTDVGLFTIYYGCDEEDTYKCRSLIDAELKKMADNKLTPRKLESAKRQYIGQLTVAGSSAEQTALSIARGTLFAERALSHKEIAARINEISADDICRMAQGIMTPGYSVLTLS